MGGLSSAATGHVVYLKAASQLQALSFIVHIPIVCFGIALPAFIGFVEWRYVRSGDELYRTLARRWTRIMAALFVVGAVTGTILSFEMGTLWPSFMSTFGGVFGLGFAIEGFSFFLEAIFIGIYVYSWKRFSPRLHLLTVVPIIFSGFTGSLMVISVNAWMQHPSGFRLVHGKAVDVHPWAALFGNSFLWNELTHMYVGAFMVAGFLLAMPYAIGRLRGRWGRYERTAFVVPFTFAAIASPLEVVVGDWVARDVATQQPTKLAAIEGLGHTTRGASEHLLGWFSNGAVKFGIDIPHLLSLLAFHSWNAKVQGLDAVPVAYRPPVNITRYSFQFMVAVGSGLALLAVWFMWTRYRRRQLPTHRWFYLAAAAAGPGALAALIAGWLVTEVGRQPWIVYKVMTATQAVTRTASVPFSYGVLAAAYVLLAIAAAWILRRLAKTPLDGPSDPQGTDSQRRRLVGV